MRLVMTEYISLDGVMEEPGVWSGPWFGEKAGAFKFAELQATDALLLGRLTYEGFAAAWPKMQGTGEFGEKMNSMPKYVVSTTLQNPEWTGTTVISGNVAEEIQKLKQQPGQDLLLSGSGQLARSLMAEDLIDVYRFMLYPVVLGEGRRLFADGMEKRPLELVETRQLDKGVTVLEYQPQA
jgi:dihydrofolate reductase